MDSEYGEIREARLLGVSRCGLPSWRARLDGVAAKIYRCHSPEQARFIDSLSKLQDVSSYFPEPLARRGSVLAVRWIEGEAWSGEALKRNPLRVRQVARLQAALHSRTIEGAPGFSYSAFLKRRFSDFQAIWPVTEAYESLTDKLDSEPAADITPRISHPDVTPQNLVQDSFGKLKVIDNELLSQSSEYHIDLFNTDRVLGSPGLEAKRRYYLESYMEAGGDLSNLVARAGFFSALWQLRMIGALLQDGLVAPAIDAARRAVTGGSPRHPLIEVAQELLS
ncbi:MAG: hypothetical protein OES47_14730 [Acidobacteriota bacterium]|nr:hypothetical protein [Acidobacteriota bacterium]